MGRKRRIGGRAIHPDLQAKLNEIAHAPKNSLRKMALECELSHGAFNPAANGEQNLSKESGEALARVYGASFGFTERQVLFWIRNPDGGEPRTLPSGLGGLALVSDPVLREAQDRLAEQLAKARRDQPDDAEFARYPRLAEQGMRELHEALLAERRRIAAEIQSVAAVHGIDPDQFEVLLDHVMQFDAAEDARFDGAGEDGQRQ